MKGKKSRKSVLKGQKMMVPNWSGTPDRINIHESWEKK